MPDVPEAGGTVDILLQVQAGHRSRDQVIRRGPRELAFAIKVRAVHVEGPDRADARANDVIELGRLAGPQLDMARADVAAAVEIVRGKV